MYESIHVCTICIDEWMLLCIIEEQLWPSLRSKSNELVAIHVHE